MTAGHKHFGPPVVIQIGNCNCRNVRTDVDGRQLFAFPVHRHRGWNPSLSLLLSVDPAL
jgi:hypothetical protein